MGLGTSSSNRPETAELLHRLRSTLARLKGLMELAELDGHPFGAEAQQGMVECLVGLASLESDLMGPLASPELSVLIVDDDLRLLELTALQLGRAGWSVSVSTSLPDPIPKSRRVIIDFAVLEALSPDQRDQLRQSTFIVVTGSADPSARRRSLDAGASGFLLKPVDNRLLLSLLRAVGR